MIPDSENADQKITAEQGSAGADERARPVASAGEAQGIYVALLNAANQGFCTIEMKFDDDNRPVDYLFLEVNPSFERQTGIENAVGRWMRDISPDQDRYWYDLYGRVALTGIPERLENFSTALDRWFSVYALKIEGAGRVAVLFDDITDRKRAEAALRASEERFRSFVTASADAVYRMSPDWSQLLQLDGQGFVNNTSEPCEEWMDQYILPDDRELVQKAIDQAIRTKGQFDLEHRVIRMDGTPGWTSSRATPMLDDHGEIIEWLGTASDITQAKAEREGLLQGELRYRTLFEAIDSGFGVFEVIFDKDGRAIDYRFIEANPAFERQSGLVNAVGRRIREFAPDLEEHWFERYGRVALTGKSMHIEGEAAPLGRWFDINAFRVGEPEQRRVAVLFTDITARRNAEIGLRESEEQFGTLLNQAPLGVYLVDSDLVIRQVNPVALPVFGDIAGGPVGRNFDEVIHILWGKDYADELVGIFRHTLETGDPYVALERAEYRVDRDIIEYYEWRVDRIPLPGDQYGVVCYFRDISEQVYARKENEQAREFTRESEKRQAFLLKLSDALRAELTADAVANRALHMLFEQMGLDRCYIGIYRPEEDRAEFPHQVCDDRLPPLPAQVRLSDFPKALQVASDRTLVIDNVVDMEGLSDSDRANLHGLGLRAFVASTLRKGKNNPLWAIVAVSTQPRVWTQGEVLLVDETAERTWAAVERARAEAARIKADQSFTRLFEASPAPFLVLAPDPERFTITEVNDAYLAATMRTREELVGRALFDAFPDNPNEPTSTGVSDLRASLERVLATRRPDALPGLNYDIARPDGSFEERWWSPVNSPILNEKGEVEAIIHNANDVTEDRRAEAALRDSERHQGLLLAELQHRVRNILAMVRSVARRTAENCEDVDDYVRHLDGRLSSLARVQTVLTRHPTRGANLYDLVLDELQMQTASPAQYQIEGPEVELSPKAAEVLSLAIHELATNSIKYGVLAQPSGALSIRWSVDDRDGQDWLRFQWNEPVSPRPDRLSRTGFGTDLIKNRVPYELRGVGDIVIGNDEVVAQIDFPLINSQTGLHGGTQDKDLAQ